MQPTRSRLTIPTVFILLGLATGCGGGATEATGDATDSGTASLASPGSSGSPNQESGTPAGFQGMWIDEEGQVIEFLSGDRYAKYRLVDAQQPLRPAPIERDEAGLVELPVVTRNAVWEVRGENLVSLRNRRDENGELQRVEDDRYRRFNDEEWRTFWHAGAPRLVREGDLPEIRRAEAAGFDFSKLPDPTGPLDQVVYLDMLECAARERQREILAHWIDRGHDLAASGAVREAVRQDDPELLEFLLDAGFPLAEVMRDSPSSVRDEVAVVLVERGFPFPEVPLYMANLPRAGCLLIEGDAYGKELRFLNAAVRMGRTDLIDKVLAEASGPDEDPSKLFQYGVHPAVESGQLEALERVLSKGASLEGRFGPKGLLQLAVESGNLEMLAFLIDQGFDPSERPRSGKPALEAAILADAAPPVFELLFERGARAEKRHLGQIRVMMKKHREAVEALFHERLE